MYFRSTLNHFWVFLSHDTIKLVLVMVWGAMWKEESMLEFDPESPVIAVLEVRYLMRLWGWRRRRWLGWRCRAGCRSG